MKNLFESFKIRNTDIKNRIVVPPMVVFNWAGDDGIVSDNHVEHYRSIAKGGHGLIIQEATCVSKDGRLADSQLGIWSDEHVEGLSKIVEAVHSEGYPIVVQIHHAGIMGIEEEVVCPSRYTLNRGEKDVTARALTLDEVKAIQKQFIDAGLRAFRAGYDGIELHGCHNYLICQFLNNKVNTRDDAYGKDPMLFVKEIYSALRKEVSEDFIIGIRLGGFEPTLEDGISHAKELDDMGIDFINVSYGFGVEQELFKESDFELKEIMYAAKEIKQNVKCAVFAVHGVKCKEDADDVLVNCDVDMVNVGRGVLVNYNWANDALEGRDTGKCIECRVCQWRFDCSKCAGRILYNRNK